MRLGSLPVATHCLTISLDCARWTSSTTWRASATGAADRINAITIEVCTGPPRKTGAPSPSTNGRSRKSRASGIWIGSLTTRPMDPPGP